MPITRVSGNLPINFTHDRFKDNNSTAKQEKVLDAETDELLRRISRSKLLRAKEVAAWLSISKTAAYRLMRTELPSIKIGDGCVRVYEEDVQQYLMLHKHIP